MITGAHIMKSCCVWILLITFNKYNIFAVPINMWNFLNLKCLNEENKMKRNIEIKTTTNKEFENKQIFVIVNFESNYLYWTLF